MRWSKIASTPSRPEDKRLDLYFRRFHTGRAGRCVSAGSVPLPAALPLFGTGLMALMGFLGRRGKRT